jgi:hypothetical protein
MTTPTKVISLVAHPVQVSHLCFAADGILEETTVELGAAIAPGASLAPFDFRLFYHRLTSPGAPPGVLPGGIPTVPPDHSRPLYDAAKLEAYVARFRLASLRAEPARAALAQALSARQNAFYAKYGNAADIIAVTKQSYDVTLGGAKTSKPDRLAKLIKLAQQQANALEAAYAGDGRKGVVKHTGSAMLSHTDSSGHTDSTGHSAHTGQHIEEDFGDTDSPFGPPPLGGAPLEGRVDLPKGASPLIHEGTSGDHTDSGDRTASGGSATEEQTIVNTDYGYRMPFIESQAQNERAQISLIDEGFAEYLSRQNFGSLETVFANELLSIDNDVYQCQIALANRWLMSPIEGTVTVLYKYPGDAVRAGEPVMRVENNAQVLLTAGLVCRGRIAVGANATVNTTLFDTPGAPRTPFPGKVVAVRGQQEDDRWDVTIKCGNLDAAGNAILPTGYRFDYDDTTVTVS